MKSNKYMPFIKCLLLVLLMVSGTNATAQVAKLYPVDEADQDASFFLFRSRLIQAVTARDTVFLYAHLSPTIKNSFGGDDGIAEFKEVWRPADADSELWPTLAKILSAGGSFEQGRFSAPYTFAAYPSAFDAFEHGVVVGENVRVRATPDVRSAVLETLSYDVVQVLSFALDPGEEEAPEGWERVQLADGQIGYVASQYIVSPIDYRAGFHQRDGKWEMIYLVAGD